MKHLEKVAPVAGAVGATWGEGLPPASVFDGPVVDVMAAVESAFRK